MYFHIRVPLNPKELDFDNENILIFNIVGAEQPV